MTDFRVTLHPNLGLGPVAGSWMASTSKGVNCTFHFPLGYIITRILLSSVSRSTSNITITMPSPISFETNYANLPPFPDDVPTAPIEQISLQQLLDGSREETIRLFQSCCDTGFFYLDLRGAQGPGASSSGTAAISGEAYLRSAAALFAAAPSIFATPEADKRALDFAARGSYYGFKPLGSGVVDRTGRRDANEFFNMGKDDLLCQAPREPSPPAAEPHRAAMADFVRRSHAIVTVLLARLEQGLAWPRGALTERHRLAAASGDQVRFVHAPVPPGRGSSRGAAGARRTYGLWQRAAAAQSAGWAADPAGTREFPGARPRRRGVVGVCTAAAGPLRGQSRRRSGQALGRPRDERFAPRRQTAGRPERK